MPRTWLWRLALDASKRYNGGRGINTMSDTANPVIIYSTTWCGFCKMAKDYFDKKGITYIDKDVERDQDAYNELMHKVQGNYMGVPVIDIDGQIILGFDRPRIDTALSGGT